MPAIFTKKLWKVIFKCIIEFLRHSVGNPTTKKVEKNELNWAFLGLEVFNNFDRSFISNSVYFEFLNIYWPIQFYISSTT